MKRLLVATLLVLASLSSAARASTAPLFPDHPPVGFTLTADQAQRIADATSAVRREKARHPGAVLTSVGYEPDQLTWIVDYYRDGEIQVEAIVFDPTGKVLETWTGIQSRWVIARPGEGKFGHRLNAPYVWIPLCIAFLVPFFDPRRPFRLLHLDLLVLLAFGVSHVFFTHGEIYAAVPLAYPVMAYVLVRMLMIGFRPRERPGPLVPLVPMRALVVALIFLVGFRAMLNITDSGVSDVGFAGVIGADRILRGDPLYDGHFPEVNPRGDTYGPIMYVAYIPFYLAFGWSGKWDKLPAAHAAAIAFDVLTMLGLFLLGRATRAGPAGMRLGVALAFAWAAYPYTAYVLQGNTNDALVSALLVFALVALARGPARGALVGLAGAAKLAPLVLLPLFAGAPIERAPRSRAVALTAVGAGGVLLVAASPFIAQVGFDQVFDRTLGFQFERTSPFSIWGLEPSLEWLQRVVQLGTVGLALAVFIWPRRKTAVQVAALAAAIVIGLELAVTHWFYLYIVWFLPLVLFALFACEREPEPA